ncbi:uncharacterized protein LOC135950644 [Calliphora vicina]|uniref:uncharacterized protein LOC135950644 n=1 Tax=Calliphora vicina TaxID=7373 RepID=UPI00325B5962
MAGDKDETYCQTLPSNAYGGTGCIRTKSLQREQIISNIRMMKTNINELFQLSVYQLEVKLSLLERQLQSFERVQLDLESLDESEITQNHRATFEDAYYEIKSVILERLVFHNGIVSETPFSSTRVATQSSNSHRPLLPTLQLCKFSGNYKDWMEFYNVFCLLVHDNQELSPVSKFQYLKSCLTDSASRLIQSLEVNAPNYQVAFDLLKTRYNNKRQLFQSHLLEIFNIEKVSKPNVMALRLFIDNINASMRALESIVTKQQITNGIMLHLVVSKLDTDFQSKWEESQSLSLNTSTSSSTLQLPSWDDLVNFLERRCKSLEIYESTHPNSVCAKHACNVTVRSLASDFTTAFDAVILSSISSCHPQ